MWSFSNKISGWFWFILYIYDDYSHYGYIYPIIERSEALDKFKVFKVEVQNQRNLRIKVVRLDRGGEYYGRHALYGQIPGPFAKYLQENSIVAQYSTPGEPQQNGVAERRNHTYGHGSKDVKLFHFACGFMDGSTKDSYALSK